MLLWSSTDQWHVWINRDWRLKASSSRNDRSFSWTWTRRNHVYQDGLRDHAFWEGNSTCSQDAERLYVWPSCRLQGNEASHLRREEELTGWNWDQLLHGVRLVSKDGTRQHLRRIQRQKENVRAGAEISWYCADSADAGRAIKRVRLRLFHCECESRSSQRATWL